MILIFGVVVRSSGQALVRIEAQTTKIDDDTTRVDRSRVNISIPKLGAQRILQSVGMLLKTNKI